MIHEAMVLDHGGVDLAFIVYGSSLKLWLLGAIIVDILVPVRTGNAAVDLAVSVAGMMVLAIGVGIIESCMARLRMIRVPQLLLGAVAFSTLAMILVLR
jgi:formate hydrogenlyase subunit 4